MKLIRNIACFLSLLLLGSSNLHAQLYKIELNQKIDKSSMIAEGRITDQHSFWNDEHTIIYTANKLHIYKLFKGKLISKEIEVLTQGGTVGNKCLKVSEVLQLQKNETGIFFLHENTLQLHSPFTKNILYDVYSSEQGFLRYDESTSNVFAPFATYNNKQALYNLIRQRTGETESILDNSKLDTGVVSNGTGGTLSTITSFSPATVHAGAINDAQNNILTINGSGFSDNPSGSAGIKFKDANSNNSTPDYLISYNSPYIISWADTKIVLHVPDRAGTGKFAVIFNDGTSLTASGQLQVFYAVLDAEFNLDNGTSIIREPRLMNTNGSGGYTFQYSTNTAGGGKDFTTSPAKQTFQRAIATWKEITGANLTEGSPTTVQKVSDDQINLILFDNNNTGVPKMADGVLESTYSWFSACAQGTGLLTAQKTGFDILIRNNGVSLGGNVSFEDGPCFPAQGSYDLEMIVLHEIGHALNLAHINDDYQDGGGGYPTINPSKLMHYAILDYVDRRSPDASAYQGALYTIAPQGNTYGNCGLFSSEMSPLQTLAIANDQCPSTFPSTELQDNTTVSFDLVHATSDISVDPSFKQITCNNIGTSVTNNAYYAFLTGTKTDISLNISNYTTVPAALGSCAGQSMRLALYDVQSCPVGQSYPQPVACSGFTGNGMAIFSGLQQNHKYLLYVDGVRNTKASFNITFNSDSSTSGSGSVIVTVYPNPVINGTLKIKIENATGSAYNYALFDVVGRLLNTAKISIIQSTQIFSIDIPNLATGIYFLRLADENGKTIATKKILKD